MKSDDFMEAIHVELSDEGGHVGMFVVVRKQGAGELGLVLDPEGAPVLCPADELVSVGVVHHLPELGQEGGHIGGSLWHNQLH